MNYDETVKHFEGLKKEFEAFFKKNIYIASKKICINKPEIKAFHIYDCKKIDNKEITFKNVYVDLIDKYTLHNMKYVDIYECYMPNIATICILSFKTSNKQKD